MIQYKKDIAAPAAITDILPVSKIAFNTISDMYRHTPLSFCGQYTGDHIWIKGDGDSLRQMLTALFRYIISQNSDLTELVLAVAASESKVQISICDDGNTAATETFGIISDSIANGKWTATDASMRQAFETIHLYDGSIRFVRTGKPYNQLLIEFPIVHATKD